MIYFSYAHSLIYRIILWGNSPQSNSIFKLQKKKIIRIIMNVGVRNSWHEIFKVLKIFPLDSQYIFSLLIFVFNNKEMFTRNSGIHCINTRHCKDLHSPLLRLSKSQKSVYFSGIKILNRLPMHIKNLSYDIKEFKHTLKKFLLSGFFYSIEEYFDWDQYSILVL